MRNAAAQANAEIDHRAALGKAADTLGELRAIHKTLRAVLKELREQGKPHVEINVDPRPICLSGPLTTPPNDQHPRAMKL